MKEVNMPVRKFTLTFGASSKVRKPRRPPVRTRKVSLPSARQTLAALKATAGATRVLARLPGIDDISLWQNVASFRVCRKTGTAEFLDLWDCDHLDGFTDMARSLSACRAWFSANGFSQFGSAQTRTGRVNCFFRAPTNGIYVCNAQLESWPSTSTSVVECLIDNASFGPLAFSGLIAQPHLRRLSAGFHHFRIRQISGAFFFVSLTVVRVPVVA
jgi:hypothetical protein